MGISRAVNIADLRLLAKRRLPRVVFDYIDGGADGEVTLRENCRAFESIEFQPRNAVECPAPDLRTTVLGTQVSLPFLLAPVGSSRLFYPRGECAAAREAGIAGTAYIQSTLSGCRLEDVKASTPGPAWYQLYLVGGRDVAMATIERARTAGFSALVVTIDTPVAGLRERDVRNGAKELASRNFLECDASGSRANAVCRRRGCTRAIHGLVDRLAVDSSGVGRADRHKRRSFRGRCMPRGRCRSRRHRRVESRCTSTRYSGADNSRASRNCRSGWRTNGNSDGQRHSTGKRYRKSVMLGCTRRTRRPRVRVRPRSGRRPGRSPGHSDFT
jgi:FMN-dependent dehydrogenase